MCTIFHLSHTLILTNLSHSPISLIAFAEHSCVSDASCGVGSGAVLLEQSQKDAKAHTIATINNKLKAPPTIANVVIIGSDGCGKDDFNIAKTPNTPPTDIASSMITFARYKQTYKKV